MEYLTQQIKIGKYIEPIRQNSQISGKIIVFTGTLASVTRGEAKAKAESMGARVSGSLSKNTDFIILGANAGAKAKKAAATKTKKAATKSTKKTAATKTTKK